MQAQPLITTSEPPLKARSSLSPSEQGYPFDLWRNFIQGKINLHEHVRMFNDIIRIGPSPTTGPPDS